MKIIIRSFLILLAFTFFQHQVSAKNYEFNELVIFGDSLSDIGNKELVFLNKNFLSSKMIAGDSLIYNEYLAPVFTGKPITPAAHGGSNYANSDSTVSPPDGQITSILSTVENYAEHNLPLSPNNLYLVWGGANDLSSEFTHNIGKLFQQYLTNNLVAVFKLQKIDANLPPLGHDGRLAARNIYLISRWLLDNGAKYVLTPNLFNLTSTPIVGLFFFILHLIYPLLCRLYCLLYSPGY